MMDEDNQSADSQQSPKDGDPPVENTSIRSTVSTGPVAKGGEVTGIKIVDSIIRAAIQVPGWAWVTGIGVISIALILAVFVSNPDPILNRIPTPSPLPTQLAFAPAAENETLIIVADFKDNSNGEIPAIDPAQDVADTLKNQVRTDQLDIRVERLNQFVDESNAKNVLEIYHASLVVWGSYDSVSIKPILERSATLEYVFSDQEGVSLSLIDPNKSLFDVKTDDLPGLTKYLVLLILGLDQYNDNNYILARNYFNSAILDLKDSINPSEAFFYLGNTYILFEQTDYQSAISYRGFNLLVQPVDQRIPQKETRNQGIFWGDDSGGS